MSEFPVDPENPTLAEVFYAAMRSTELSIRGPFPGYVLEYTAEGGGDPATAKVQPAFQEVPRVGARGEPVDLPAIPHAIVCSPGTKQFGISMPLEKGDEGLVIIIDRSMEAWRQSDGSKPVDPVFNWVRNLADAYFFPIQVHSPIKSDPDKLTVGLSDGSAQVAISKAGKIEITATGDVEVNAKGNVEVYGDGETRLGTKLPTDFVALSQKVAANEAAFQAWAASHTHSFVGLPVTVPGVTLVPVVPPPVPGSVAATKTKAK